MNSRHKLIVQRHTFVDEKVKVEALTNKYITDLKNSTASIIKSKPTAGQSIKSNSHPKQIPFERKLHGGSGGITKVAYHTAEKVHKASCFHKPNLSLLPKDPSSSTNTSNFLEAQMAFISAKKGINESSVGVKPKRNTIKWKHQRKSSAINKKSNVARAFETTEKFKNNEPLKILKLKGLPPLKPWYPGTIPHYKMSGSLYDMEDLFQKAVLEMANDTFFDGSKKGQELKEQSSVIIQKRTSMFAPLGPSSGRKDEDSKVRKMPRRPWINWNFKTQWPMPLI